MSGPLIGILSLQGDVREHALALADIDAETLEVRNPEQLARVDALVLPGGESTAMSRLLTIFGMVAPLRAATAAGLPMYGSCAAMILLAQQVHDTRSDAVNFGAIDISVRRNAFSRQGDSFEVDLPCAGMAGGPFRAAFIRAPWLFARARRSPPHSTRRWARTGASTNSFSIWFERPDSSRRLSAGGR